MKLSHKLNEIPSRNLPCLSSQGVDIFALTADQRYLARGSVDFLRTHFPITLQSHHFGRAITFSENDLLAQMLQTNGIVGNRVMILYGAAGSGKSEMLRWLQTKVQQEDQSRAQVMLRISRTDLDIFHIFQRFQSLIATPIFPEATQQRWEACRQKPRTLAKILVLTALEQLLTSDDHINALYYQLVDVVQTNLERYFTAMDAPHEDAVQFIELFSREDLNQMLQDSVIPIPLEYEALRHAILKVFRDQLFEGLNFADLLKRVAFYVQETYHQRPILLIDDLVQSINLFATDLLDYFITLEEGCWDVLIGVTPNSLDSTLRGKELLDRIHYLDTIDDRVQKLWLSDEYGLSSSFLNEDNCTEYVRLYLGEYKRSNHVPCNSSCLLFQKCSQLDPDHAEDVLAPFNENVLRRIFRALPDGKGKVRYFTLYLREIFERLSQGADLIVVLSDYIKPEQAAYHENTRLARIYEFYGALSDGEIGQVSGDDLAAIYSFFGISKDEQQTPPLVTSLLKQRLVNIVDAPSPTPSHQQKIEIDPSKEAVKAWLQGEDTNKQLLRNVRRGVSKAIKDGYAVDCMTRLNTAKSNHLLRWTQARFDTTPPIQMAGVDDYAGFSLEREIGPLAYLLYDYADTAGRMEQDVRGMIVTNEHFPHLMFQSMIYRNETKARLEKLLGLTVEHFAFSLFLLARCFGYLVTELPPAVDVNISVELFLAQHYPPSLENERPRLSVSQVSIIRRLFDDCFKLRENIYDASLLERIIGEVSLERAFSLLSSIPGQDIETDFRLNELPLAEFIVVIQRSIGTLIQLKEYAGVRTVLINLCEAGLGQDEFSRKLSLLLGMPGNTQALVDLFVQTCTLAQLHTALLLASLVDTMHYERSQEQLRAALEEVEGPLVAQEQLLNKTPILKRHFTRKEVAILVDFSHQGFRLSVDQFNTTFLTKIAEHFPDLYKQLEVRLQRG